MPAIRELALSTGRVDLDRRRVLRGDKGVALTAREAELLAYLAARPGRSVSQEELLVEVWGYRPGVRSRTVEATIHTLRRKIEQDPAEPEHLLTIRGEGYRFVPARPTAPALLLDIDVLDPDARLRAVLLQAEVLAYDDPEQALDLVEGLPAGLPAVEERRGALLSALGRLEEAALALERAAVDPSLRPRARLEAARVCGRLCRFEEAEAHCEAVVAEGEPIVAAQARLRLGVLLLDQGRVQEGFAALDEARATFERLGAWRLLGFAQGEVGMYRLMQGRADLAHEALLASIEAAVRSRGGYAERCARFPLALALRLLGRNRAAEAERARAEAIPVGRWEEPGLYLFRALDARLSNRDGDARRLVEEGLARHAARPNPMDGAVLLALKAALEGDPSLEPLEPLRRLGPSFGLAFALAGRGVPEARLLARALDMELHPGLVAACGPDPGQSIGVCDAE